MEKATLSEKSVIRVSRAATADRHQGIALERAGPTHGDIEMTQPTSLLLIKAVLLSGLALWLAVIVLNNVVAFRNGVFAVGMLMGMQLFDQEPPIRTPLLSRRVTNAVWHRMVFSFVLVMEVATMMLLAAAAIMLIGTFFGLSDGAAAMIWANLALAAFIALSLIMLLGGAWFAYYVRQETMQITHFILIGLGVAGTLLVNMPMQ
ncbi:MULTISPECIES: DUF2165 family protein [Ensifer]|jgi:hypothetical protein|nr:MULTISPECIES: DUF2165 family protein [Ensifer]KQU89885.1 hypothetical protein ASD00_26585 [Ensifer sp. Root31]PSS62853.1 hypothetical protein C6558_20745 [Ensifer sp. NM-2]MBD9490728.1 DUF2165 family protein [Ensifer sp. ENS11]NOV19565.1 DUF2165 family protein [Ensifer canadensis]UBI78275.1 DUF2165 domain-containing protein [Ensifer canadensis]